MGPTSATSLVNGPGFESPGLPCPHGFGAPADPQFRRQATDTVSMDAVFFVGIPNDAAGVRSVEDLPHEPAGDPLPIDSPGALAGLIAALGLDSKGALRQLRDTTCQSFPVWCFGRDASTAIAKLDEAGADAVAERWLAAEGDALGDCDLYELTLCLASMKDALRNGDLGSDLFVLLEEKAW